MPSSVIWIISANLHSVIMLRSLDPVIAAQHGVCQLSSHRSVQMSEMEISFRNARRECGPFFIGDYTGIVVGADGIAHPIWMDIRELFKIRLQLAQEFVNCKDARRESETQNLNDVLHDDLGCSCRFTNSAG